MIILIVRLDFVINDYFKLVSNKSRRWEDSFDGRRDVDIFNDLMYDLTIERAPEEVEKLYKRMELYSLSLGDHQFNQYTPLFLLNVKANMIKALIYEMTGTKPPGLLSFNIDIGYFLDVFKQFVRFAYQSNLKKHKPFFPKGFTESTWENLEQ